MLMGRNWDNVVSHLKYKLRKKLYYSAFQIENVALHFFFWRNAHLPNSKLKVKSFYVVGSTKSYQIPFKN